MSGSHTVVTILCVCVWQHQRRLDRHNFLQIFLGMLPEGICVEGCFIVLSEMWIWPTESITWDFVQRKNTKLLFLFTTLCRDLTNRYDEAHRAEDHTLVRRKGSWIAVFHSMSSHNMSRLTKGKKICTWHEKKTCLTINIYFTSSSYHAMKFNFTFHGHFSAKKWSHNSIRVTILLLTFQITTYT